MSLLLLSHETIWGSPLEPLRRRFVLSSSNALQDTKPRTSSNPSSALASRQPRQHGAIAGAKRLLGALPPILTPLIAGAGAAAAALVPVARNSISDFLRHDVPHPLSSPFAFLGYVYIGLCAFYHSERALLRWPYFRNTALQRDYLDFYDWFVGKTGMMVPRDTRRVPYATLLETFLQDMYRSRTDPSCTKPTWTQIVLPNFLHISLMHLYFSVNGVWRAAGENVPFGYQLGVMVLMLASGTLVNRITWTMARQALFRLPVADQSALAVQNLKTDAEFRRSEAMRDFQRELGRGRIGPAWTSLKRWTALSRKLSQLYQLNPGIGASSGTSALSAMSMSVTPLARRTQLVKGVVHPLANDFAEGETFPSFRVLVGIWVLELFQESLIHEPPSWMGPWARSILQPQAVTAFAAVTIFRVAEYTLALVPGVGHVAHLVGTAVGASFGGLVCLLRVYASRRPPQ